MSKRRRKLRVGDVVTFVAAGGVEIRAQVIEDRGGLGVGGRQLVRIRVPRAEDDPVPHERAFEMPAEDLTLVDASPKKPA